MNNRHAYLIIAHRLTFVLETLVQMIDDERNDIYIHVDKKCKNFDYNRIKPKNANLYYTNRIKVYWGADSIIKAELILLKESTKNGNYAYYHLMSDSCLPIKSQDYIHSYLSKNSNIQFIEWNEKVARSKYKSRYQYYYPFQNNILSKTHINKFLANILVSFQKLFNIKRNANLKIYKGHQWFSITDDFARYVVDNESWIINTFKNTYICDEIFMQTLLLNSKNKKFSVSNHNCLRLIDWKRGYPYIFRNQDYDEIINSPYLFARKFNEKVDKEIIDKVKQCIN